MKLKMADDVIVLKKLKHGRIAVEKSQFNEILESGKTLKQAILEDTEDNLGYGEFLGKLQEEGVITTQEFIDAKNNQKA